MTEKEAVQDLLSALKESMDIRITYLDTFNKITEEDRFLIYSLAENGSSLTDVESLEQLLTALHGAMDFQDRYSEELDLLDKENKLLADLIVRKKLGGRVESGRKKWEREQKAVKDGTDGKSDAALTPAERIEKARRRMTDSIIKAGKIAKSKKNTGGD